ncbi:MAG: glutamyl-tRNA reductase [Ignavibacteriaceae bacterium]
MNLFAVSISHNTAPIELREALFFGDDEIKLFVEKTKGNLFNEGLIISTCNRTEIYGIPVNKNLQYSEILNSIRSIKSVNNIQPDHFKNLFSREAVTHLFEVITGIDSLLIGDNQIYHQVKDSFQLSENLHFAGFLMKRLFDFAVKTGKRAITETEISEGAVTVSYAAVQLIEKIFSSLGKKSALVIGTGESGEIAAKHLMERGIGKLAVTNRTIERAEKVAQKLNAKIIPFTNFKEYLHEYDIIISATSSENLILRKDDIKAAMKKRNYGNMVLMDIAIPRDIDPASKEIDYVFYNDIDSLNIIVEQNLEKRKNEIPKVRKIIQEEVDNFIEWYNSLEVAPTIKDLRDYFESVRAEEVGKNKNRFSSEDQEKLEIITKRIINKILHHPTLELRKLNQSDNSFDETSIKMSLLRDLFGIDNNKIAGKDETKEGKDIEK